MNVLAQSPVALVHYLPIATTALSAAFVAILLSRARRRAWAPHLVWWAVGVFFYGLGTAVESTITLHGNTETLNRVWYLFGAIWGAFPLGVGSMYLLCGRRVATWIAVPMLLYVLVTSALVLIAPMNLELLPPDKPLGRGVFQWSWLPWSTPLINLYAVVFLIGGAAYSSVNFMVKRYNPQRAVGTGLIAVGAMLPGIGGWLTKSRGLVEALYVGEFIGLAMICAGYFICLRAPAPQKSPQASAAATA